MTIPCYKRQNPIWIFKIKQKISDTFYFCGFPTTALNEAPRPLDGDGQIQTPLFGMVSTTRRAQIAFAADKNVLLVLKSKENNSLLGQR